MNKETINLECNNCGITSVVMRTPDIDDKTVKIQATFCPNCQGSATENYTEIQINEPKFQKTVDRSQRSLLFPE